MSKSYFGSTATPIGGIRLDEIASDVAAFHWDAFGGDVGAFLPNRGVYSYRKDGEKHAWNPETISA